MLIGVPKEIKNHEYRVGLTPESVAELIADGNTVLVETNAGEGIGASDQVYESHGADIIETAEEIFDRSDMIIKVKEPQSAERAMLKKGQILYTYLHLAPDPEQTKDLIESGVIDPAKTVKCALQNAASAAGTLLTTNCAVLKKGGE